MFTRIDGFLLHMWRQCNLPTRCTEAGLRSQSQNEGLLKQKGSNESWTSFIFCFPVVWSVLTKKRWCSLHLQLWELLLPLRNMREIIYVKSVSEKHPEFLELHQNFFLQPQVGGIPPLQPSLLLTTTTNAQLKPSLTGNPIKHLRGHRTHEEGNSMK